MTAAFLHALGQVIVNPTVMQWYVYIKDVRLAGMMQFDVTQY